VALSLHVIGCSPAWPNPGEACSSYLVEAGGRRFLLDLGTGALSQLLERDRDPVSAIVLSHLHWDHMQGLPFCPSLDVPDSRVDLYLPSPRPLETLTGVMSPPYFPITPDGLGGAWRFLPSASGVIEGFTVTVAAIPHKGGITHGIRVERDGVSIAYLPDHSPQVACAAAEELASGVDLLLHDGQFLPGEQALADAYGHATVADATAFAARCGARRLVLTHHAPGRTDDVLDVLAKEVEVARQGDVLTP
jgi:ribonuclease BN (tRNA processing enzyme)